MPCEPSPHAARQLLHHAVQPWQYPLVTLLGTPLYVQASLLHRSDPTLALFLKDCWATPTADDADPTQWKLVADGCPVQSPCCSVSFPGVADLPLPSHYKRLALQAFAFMNSDRSTTRDLVYLHCSIVVCDSSSPNFVTECNRQCGQTRRYKRNTVSDTSSVVGKHVVSLQGPVLFEEAPVNDAVLLLLEAPSSSWASAGTLSFLLVIATAVVALLSAAIAVRRRRSRAVALHGSGY
ncbi:zona pellucida sperm-binding protein 2-like [Petromyzon marinus]|uniref:zona pellucida sperm-binding protein 2-like n=1 Tax=Petromyzon marinus TaxID=7757 RepID=UPI003F727C0A